MPAAPLPPDEERRLARLRALAVLDTAREPLFDELTQLAAELCDMPIALVTLIDEQRQWFKAGVGLPGVQETPRDLAFCAHAILGDEVLEVPDALADPRFSDNPFVLGEPNIRAYAGAPIAMPGGERVGTLCVIDRRPHALSAEQLRRLRMLASSVQQALLLRERLVERERAQRRQAEQALVEGLSRFRDLLAEAPVGIYHADAQGRSIWSNAHHQQITGLSAAQIMGDGWVHAIHPDDREPVWVAWRACAEGGPPFDMRLRIRRPDGALRHVYSRAQAMHGPDGALTGFVGVVLDETEQVLALERLRQSNDFLDRSGRLAGVGAWQLDMLTGVLTWSDQTCRIHEVEVGHVPTIEEGISYYTPKARPTIRAAVERALADGQPWDLELPFVTARGRRIWVRAQGEVEFEGGRAVRLVGAFQDVSVRRAAEQAVAERSAQLARFYETTPAMLHVVDTQARLVSVSNLWLEKLGFERHEAIGREATSFLSPASRERMVSVVRARILAEGGVTDVTLDMVRRDGSLLPVRLNAIVQHDPEGRPQFVLAVLEDLTETMAGTAELRRERVLRERVERQAAELTGLLGERSEMLDVLAHEVRQPLHNAQAALQSASGALAARGEDAGADPMARARRTLGNVLAGIDNTLAAASLLAGARALAQPDGDVAALLAVVVGDMAAADRQRIVVEHDPELRTAAMDPALLRLALRNLLANALRAGPAGSPVVLSVRDQEDPPAVVLSVGDRGPGIPAELLPRLFERGVRGPATPGRASHGLGLYIVRRVMELHGGRAEVESTGEAGTTMRLVLPQGGAET
jgi:PAS domain S-box-containing protein